MSSRINPLELLDTANELDAAAHLKLEASKVGNLRAGNTGILEGDDIGGKCHRLSLLRAEGYVVEEISKDRDLMFDAGNGNEDLWNAKLAKSWPYSIKREEDIPVGWSTTNGTKVTGRPDLVLMDAEGKPQHGLEFKLVSSMWTARDVLLGKPKPAHVMQAAHYSMLLDVPFDLVYTSRSDYGVTGWAQKHFPQKGSPNAKFAEYNEKGEIKKVLPFNKMFPLRFTDSGVIELQKDPETGTWHETIVSKKRIMDYFEFVSTMRERRDLGPRPQNVDAFGEKMSYSLCQYCPLKQHCDDFEKEGFDKWLEKVPYKSRAGKVPSRNNEKP